MRRNHALLPLALAFAVLPLAVPAAAGQTAVSAAGVTWTTTLDNGTERVVADALPALPSGLARFGPFEVIDAHRAALVDVTDQGSPAQFAALLAAFPQTDELELLDCPGTEDDEANLALGRMIHARGLVTRVPAGGSVRSGAVELFLAGSRRIADPASEFAVHSWEDEDGRQATDYPADAPENAKYLAYYRDMGMSAEEAGAFYAMTNSVPFDDARWLTGRDMGQWVHVDSPESLDSTDQVQ